MYHKILSTSRFTVGHECMLQQSTHRHFNQEAIVHVHVRQIFCSTGKFKGKANDLDISLDDLVELLQSVDHHKVVDSRDAVMSDEQLEALLDRTLTSREKDQKKSDQKSNERNLFKVIEERDTKGNVTRVDESSAPTTDNWHLVTEGEKKSASDETSEKASSSVNGDTEMVMVEDIKCENVPADQDEHRAPPGCVDGEETKTKPAHDESSDKQSSSSSSSVDADTEMVPMEDATDDNTVVSEAEHRGTELEDGVETKTKPADVNGPHATGEDRSEGTVETLVPAAEPFEEKLVKDKADGGEKNEKGVTLCNPEVAGSVPLTDSGNTGEEKGSDEMMTVDRACSPQANDVDDASRLSDEGNSDESARLAVAKEREVCKLPSTEPESATPTLTVFMNEA